VTRPIRSALQVVVHDTVRAVPRQRLAARFAAARIGPAVPVDEHLRASVAWVERSQDAAGAGSAKSYNLLDGWLSPYPETSGYIVPTLYEAAAALDRPELRERAARMIAWVATTQLASGAFPSGEHAGSTEPMVFDTGQIIFGLVRAAVEMQDPSLHEAACRAASFLLSIQDTDGAWRKHDFAGLAHSYSCRAAWSLLVLADNGGDASHRDAACRNFDWVLSQQRSNGWYASNTFRGGQLPNTHAIAYVTESMVEGFARTGNERYLDSAIRGIAPLIEQLDRTGVILGLHDEHWTNRAHHVCVTGLAQLGRTCLRIHQLGGDARYVETAQQLARQVATSQHLLHRDLGIAGAVPGSVPTFGRYAPLQYPNWAAKFWIDLLLLLKAIDAPAADTAARSILEPQAHG
jgi:Squalene-hopene cyclase C-terminal domain